MLNADAVGQYDLCVRIVHKNVLLKNLHTTVDACIRSTFHGFGVFTDAVYMCCRGFMFVVVVFYREKRVDRRKNARITREKGRWIVSRYV
jgi:hypothetical protein